MMDDSCASAQPNETSVEVLLQFDGALLNEVKMGKPQPIVEGGEAIVVSLLPTQSQVQHATESLGLPPGSIVVGDGTPLVFVFIGEYKIPINQTTLVLQAGTSDFTFVLPNQLFLQLLLPVDAAVDELDAFEHIMYSYANLKKKPVPGGGRISQQAAAAAVGGAGPTAKPRISTRIAIGLGKVTRVACSGITKGAELVSSGVHHGTGKIVEATTACKEPTKVSESTKGHINRARVASKGVAVLSGTVATAMIGVTAVLGNFIGSRVANRVASADESGSTVDRLAGVKEVGGAAIGCIGLLFDAAGDAGKSILTSSCDGISKIVTHKLGDEAGQTTANGLGVVTDVVDIQMNVRKAGIKGIARATAQSSAMSMIDNLEKKHEKK